MQPRDNQGLRLVSHDHFNEYHEHEQFPKTSERTNERHLFRGTDSPSEATVMSISKTTVGTIIIILSAKRGPTKLPPRIYSPLRHPQDRVDHRPTPIQTGSLGQ